jgi:hypothetical protein
MSVQTSETQAPISRRTKVVRSDVEDKVKCPHRQTAAFHSDLISTRPALFSEAVTSTSSEGASRLPDLSQGTPVHLRFSSAQITTSAWPQGSQTLPHAPSTPPANTYDVLDIPRPPHPQPPLTPTASNTATRAPPTPSLTPTHPHPTRPQNNTATPHPPPLPPQ